MVSIDKELLISYINTNEVVYQMADELVEVLPYDDTIQKDRLNQVIEECALISVDIEQEKLIDMGFEELVGWSNSNDYLIRVDDTLLICIPKKDIYLLKREKA